MRRASAATLLGVLAALAACTAPPDPKPRVLADATAACFGYTARLALIDGDAEAARAVPPVVRDVAWLVEVAGPPTGLPERSAQDHVLVSIDAFTIRGDRADRLDVFVGRWAGDATHLRQTGPVRLPSGLGALQDGDQGRLHLYVSTPGGIFGIPGIVFGLRASPDRLVVTEASPLPLLECTGHSSVEPPPPPPPGAATSPPAAPQRRP